MSAQTVNPMAEYLLKIQLIVTNTEFKNKEEANKYETLESKLEGDKYVRAKTKTDMFENYQYSDIDIYNALQQRGYDEDRIFLLIKNPAMIPSDVKDELLDVERNIFINSYVEQNKYYASLSGKPFVGNDTTPADPIINIPEGFYEQYKYDNVLMRDQPIHELPIKYQELFMNSKYYNQVLSEYPDVMYLKYIGSNSIPIEVSRKARDGDILTINTNKLSTHHPIFGNVTVDSDIVHGYANIYRATRDYVYQTLRGNFSSIYANYNDLIRFLTIYMSIGASLNEFQKKSSKLIYMNNVTANNLFNLYGLPSVIMEGAPMIEFLKKFRMILMDKGTNYVYRVKDLIGYGNTDIYTLVMVKQQKFENGKPVYTYDQDTHKPIPQYEIVFRRLGTADDNTSYFKFRESTESYKLEDIRDGDPRWWNTPEVDDMLNNMNYTLSNSKYIQLSTHMSMNDIWWQSVIFLRGLLDRRSESQNISINLNRDINNSSTISLYDAIVSLIIMMHWQMVDFQGRTVPGNMYIPNDGYNRCIDFLFDGFDNGTALFRDGAPFKLAAFNFDVRNTDKNRYEAISTYEYMNPDYFMPLVDKVLDRTDNNIGEVMMKDVRLIYEYIREKVRTATTINDFRQATETYNTLFLVDPVRDWFTPDGKDASDIICSKYSINKNEYNIFTSYFDAPGTKTTNYWGAIVSVSPDVKIHYDGKTYGIYFYSVLNENAYDIWLEDTYPFRDPNFVRLFNVAVLEHDDAGIQTSSLSKTIKANYKQMIIDKVAIDVGNSVYGPSTFENLLMMENTSLYEYLIRSRAENPDEIITMLRSIIASLETYSSSSLSALSCSVLGVERYMSILKEVITYFKSYMVEFTRDEFKYIFGGILDNGGNSDMLNLIDEVPSGSIEISPTDSVSLFDVSHSDTYFGIADNNVDMMYDEALVRMEGLYKDIKQTGYKLWYDDGKRITMNPSFPIDDNENVAGNFVKRDNEYIVIINTNNIESHYPPGYYGNVL